MSAFIRSPYLLFKFCLIPLSPTRIILGAAVVYGLYRAYLLNATGNLVFYPGKVEAMHFEGASAVLSFSLQVQNTASQDVVINSLAGNIFAKDSSLVGNLSQMEPFVVPANGQAFQILQARLGMLAIVNDLIRAFQYQNFQEKITFEGSANCGGIQIPLQLSYTIGP